MEEKSVGLRPIDQKTGDRRLATLSTALARSELAWLGRSLFRVLRVAWRDRTVRPEHATTADTPLPTGPFETTRPDHIGDLLLWVPRAIDSFLIDDLTGGFGYSHATLDTGEVDGPSGKPVMAEITVHQKVMRKFQHEYGDRPFVRIPLSAAGVNVRQLVECVNSKMGEQYDFWDVLTLGEIHDPAREICSGLVADCLSEEEVEGIAWAKRLGLVHRHSVSVHSPLNALRGKAFVSPNGFAEYYGAPRGRKVTTPDTLVLPRSVDATISRMASTAARRHGSTIVVVVTGLTLLGLILMIRRRAGR